jgi:hypothetical protein
VICHQCFIEFTPKKTGYWRKRKFCSLKCNSLSQRGKKRIFSKKWRENIGNAMRGKKFTDDHKKKIGLAQKGKKAPKLSKYNKLHKGKNSNNWKGGISDINARLRMTEKHQRWIQKVLYRDNYTCVKCGSKKDLQADHIKPFSIFPKLRLDINNGQTLCKNCHKIKTKEDWAIIKTIRVKFEQNK